MSKKVNPWVEHVKKYAKENGLSYMCAVEKARESYQKPVKVGKRQMMKEKEQKRLIEFREKGLEGDYTDLIRKIEQREIKKSRREAKASAFDNYSIEKIKKEIEKLTEKSKDAKGDDVSNYALLIRELNQALLAREKKDKFSKLSLEQLKDELEKRNLIIPNIDKYDDEKQKFVYGEVKMIESAIKAKKQKQINLEKKKK